MNEIRMITPPPFHPSPCRPDYHRGHQWQPSLANGTWTYESGQEVVVELFWHCLICGYRQDAQILDGDGNVGASHV